VAGWLETVDVEDPLGGQVRLPLLSLPSYVCLHNRIRQSTGKSIFGNYNYVYQYQANDRGKGGKSYFGNYNYVCLPSQRQRNGYITSRRLSQARPPRLSAPANGI
jgi:hypothetical protein